MQAFFVVFFVYMAMYLIRNNFKAAQPFLKEEIGLSTLELGYIGLAFSITYGLGKTLLGYFVDGRNTKRIISFLLILSAITVLIMGFVLSYFGSVMGLLIVLWGLNGCSNQLSTCKLFNDFKMGAKNETWPILRILEYIT